MSLGGQKLKESNEMGRSASLKNPAWQSMTKVEKMATSKILQLIVEVIDQLIATLRFRIVLIHLEKSLRTKS